MHIKISPVFFRNFQLEQFDSKTELIHCNLKEEPQISGFEVVSFIDAVDGSKFFCDCSKKYHKHLIQECEKIRSHYVKDSWPHKLLSLLKKATYKHAICHICLASSFGFNEVQVRYGTDVLSNYHSYIPQINFDTSVEDSTAKAEIQMKLGIAKWKSETQLYKIIKNIFSQYSVEREFNTKWLGLQRLDIFIPEIKLAIEYQGEQHFRPLSVFGGEEGFQKVQSQDKEKLNKCKDNDINLVFFKFDEPLTQKYVMNKLRNFI